MIGEFARETNKKHGWMGWMDNQTGGKKAFDIGHNSEPAVVVSRLRRDRRGRQLTLPVPLLLERRRGDG